MALRYDSAVGATLIALRDRLSGSTAGPGFCPEDGLDGRTALVTGANRGLGRAVALGLATRGARVLLACRSDASGALDAIRRAGGEGEALHVDLADLRSVDALADELEDRGEAIHVAVLNAGVVPSAARRTAQGHELQLGVNYLAHVALSDQLLTRGIIPNGAFGGGAAPGGPASRVVVVSSQSHRSAELPDLERLGVFEPYGLSGVMRRYAEVKLLTTAWALELARRATVDGRPDPSVHVICPGPVRSGIAREAPAWSQPLLRPVMRTFFAAPDKAAEPVVYLGCAAELEGRTGVYLHRWAPKAPSDLAADPDVGRRVWDATHALLGARAETSPKDVR